MRDDTAREDVSIIPSLAKEDIRWAIPYQQVCQILSPRYKPLKLIGAGVASVVYKVVDHACDGEIKAAKITPLVVTDEEADRLEALRAEFRLASRFAHPNLVHYFDFEVLADGQYGVTTMEFVDGLSFDAATTDHNLCTTCKLMIELLRGLQFLHDDERLGLTHPTTLHDSDFVAGTRAYTGRVMSVKS